YTKISPHGAPRRHSQPCHGRLITRLPFRRPSCARPHRTFLPLRGLPVGDDRLCPRAVILGSSTCWGRSESRRNPASATAKARHHGIAICAAGFAIAWFH